MSDRAYVAGWGAAVPDGVLTNAALEARVDTTDAWIVERTGIRERRVAIVNIDRYGNTSAASIPLALTEAAEDERLQPGDLVLVSGFGAGMAWASALLRWGAP